MDPIITEVLKQVGFGGLAALMTWLFYKKDQELKAVRDANDNEQKEIREWALKMQERMHEALDKLATLIELQKSGRQ